MMKHYLSACTLLLAVTTSSAQTFFLDDNGITIKCIDCVSGDTGIVNGIGYTAVDNAALQAAVDNGLIPLSQLCTSLVTNTDYLFYGDSDFDADITSWDMSGVTSTYSMFGGASSFNQPIGHWDVSSVTNMILMFSNCDVFNQPLEAWDVSSVTDMEYMFRSSDAFNQPLEAWDVSSVTDMSSMFQACDAFNQPLGAWDVSSVTDMSSMFQACDAFNQPLGAWDVSSVTDMSTMFGGCDVFNQPLEAWDVSSVTDMSSMFSSCDAFNQPLEAWDVSSVTDMSYMFQACDSFNQPLGAWDVSSVTDMSSMFSSCDVFNQPLEAWDVSSVTDMRLMFWNCNVFNQPLEAWDVSSVTDMGNMFRFCDVFNQPLGAWDVSSVTDMEKMFQFCDAFNQPLEAWDVSSVTDMSSMFSSCGVFDQPLEAWDVSSVTNMRSMFHGCDVFNQPLGAWDVSSVTSMSSMFSSCDVFNQPLGAWDVSSVTSMSSMFASCEDFDQPLGAWDVSSVSNMDLMFFAVPLLQQDISNWCVLEIPFEPYGFNSGGQLSQSQLPVWGECPGCVVPEGNCNCQSVDADNDGVCDNEDCSFQFQLCLNSTPCSQGNELLPFALPDHGGGNYCFQESFEHECMQHSMLIDGVPESAGLSGFFINVEHPYLGDLNATITCSGGGSTSILSCQAGGGSGSLGADGGADYFWKENSALGTMEDWPSAFLPSATYEIDGDWSELENCASNGTWTLEVCDIWGGVLGVVYDWGIVFESAEGEVSMQTASCATSLGCLDEAACNYDAEADYDNGQCEYPDECGICGGEGAIYECGCCDCNELDACGVCNGPGPVSECGCSDIPEGDCDCNGNQLDALGVCGGDCAADADADGICDDVDDCVGQNDACGVCNGPGPIFECGCFEVPEGNCDCESIDSDGDGICDSEDDCFSLEEDPGSCCELAIAQFDCSFNGIGSCSDTLNVAGWQEVDSLEIYFSYSPSVSSSGTSWPGDLALQLITSTGDSVLMGGFWNPILPSDVGGEYLGSQGQIWGWPQNSDSAAVYTQVIDLSAYDLIGEGDWVVTVWNTYTASPTWEVDVVLHGVCGQEGVSCVNDADGDGICDFEDDCVGEYDACGSCNGEGPTLACGCDPVPENACDCDGNQLDALGVCGGDCVSDVNGNGICDLEELSESGESMCGQGTVWNEELGVCVVAVPTDANFDGCVGINDLLELLAFYGQGCE